jgi:hypothetical protein
MIPGTGNHSNPLKNTIMKKTPHQVATLPLKNTGIILVQRKLIYLLCATLLLVTMMI